MKISLLTGGDDASYALPLASSLFSKGIRIDFIGNDEMQNAEVVRNGNVNYLNLRGDQNESAPVREKSVRLLKYYIRLIKYAFQSDAKIFHILWFNKFIYFDRTILNLYYKVLGKKLVYTAHNINDRERDGTDSRINRLTLRFMYKVVDHIFVHTKKMKVQLIENFNIRENKVTVIPFGINNYVPRSELTSAQAKMKLHLEGSQRILLFFGQIAPYKGLEYLIVALVKLKAKYNNVKLIVAGRIKSGQQAYWQNIQRVIKEHALEDYIIDNIQYIPDEEVEIYFKASDVLILPYKNIFQTGLLFLAYNFGLPAIASDVGSLKEEIIEGETGFIFRPEDPDDLSKKIELYFQSDMFNNLETNRSKIIEYANEKYSWEKVAEKTYAVYKNLL